MHQSSDIPTVEPEVIVAGDTVKWKKSLDHYKASDGWTLTYYIRGAVKTDVTATASGDDHLVTISASTTAQWSPGTYWWIARVSKSGEAYTVANGIFKVKENLAGIAGTYDGRSHARRVLEALESVREEVAAKGYAEIEIAGRRYKITSIEQYNRWYRDVKAQVMYEEWCMEQGVEPGKKRKILIRFS